VNELKKKLIANFNISKSALRRVMNGLLDNCMFENIHFRRL